MGTAVSVSRDVERNFCASPPEIEALILLGVRSRRIANAVGVSDVHFCGWRTGTRPIPAAYQPAFRALLARAIAAAKSALTEAAHDGNIRVEVLASMRARVQNAERVLAQLQDRRA